MLKDTNIYCEIWKDIDKLNVDTYQMQTDGYRWLQIQMDRYAVTNNIL